MRWSEIASHRFFNLPPEQSRTHLRWARILALVLGIAMLVTGMWSFGLGDSFRQRTDAAEFLAIAFILLSLGPHAGRGNVRASGVLLGLAVLKGLVSNPSFILLPIVEIWIFAQGFRGAVALSPRSRDAAPPDGSPDLGEWFDSARRTLNQAFDRAPRRSVVDLVLGLLLLAVTYRSFRAAAPTGPGGDMFGLGAMIMIFALVTAVLGLLLLVAAAGAFTGKRWVQTVRTVAYVPLIALCVLGSPLWIELLKEWFRG